MPFYTPGGGVTTPFGRNEFLRSTRGMLVDSYTIDSLTHPSVTIDAFPQKVLQPGTVIAMATSGANSGKVGVFQAGLADGRQTAANIVGIVLTFLPYQLMDGDQEIGVLYGGVVDTTRCLEYNAGGAPIAIQAGTITAMVALPRLGNLIFD